MTTFKIIPFFLLLTLSLFAESKNCPFCKEEVVCRQFVHERAEVITLYCLTPATKGNLLIIPKRHIERFEELTPCELLAIQCEINFMSKVFKEFYGINEFVLIEKNGKNAGQTVQHIHFHMIPAPKPFAEIVEEAFNYREKITPEEMKERTTELQQFICAMQGAA